MYISETRKRWENKVQYVRDKSGNPFWPKLQVFLSKFPFYRIPILPRKNSNTFQLFSIPISRKISVLVSKSLLFVKLFIKIFPFSWKLSNLPDESPFYRIPILPRKNSSVFGRKCTPLFHFIEFPFYREHTVLVYSRIIKKIRTKKYLSLMKNRDFSFWTWALNINFQWKTRFYRSLPQAVSQTTTLKLNNSSVQQHPQISTMGFDYEILFQWRERLYRTKLCPRV